MQKHFLMILMTAVLLIICSMGFAGTVSVGPGALTNNLVPFNGNFKYNYTQQLYTPAQINKAGSIEKISFFYVSGAIANNKDWKIFLGHTNKTSFGTNADWVSYSDLSLVFQGDVSSMVPAANNW